MLIRLPLPFAPVLNHTPVRKLKSLFWYFEDSIRWVRVLGYGSGVRGRKVKSHDCALASDLLRACHLPGSAAAFYAISFSPNNAKPCSSAVAY